MALKVYNTLTRRKDDFTPIEDKKLNIFVCGPTVYDYSHIGHGKTYVQFDVIVKYLRWKGYDVFYLMNITDIDDKIIKRADEKKMDWGDLRTKFEKEFFKDMKLLGNDAVDEYARATDYIPEIIKQVKDLIDKGYGYETSDGIYFEISKFKEYGKLSNQDLKKIKSGARVEVNDEKKHPSDFVLWKKFKPGEPFWDSPWGKGRPGWHIEDTAITEKYFGPQYDVHGGAMDLIFPHHECEIAQMEAASGKKPLVKYWLHTAFLNMGKDKMSKSLGNIIAIREALKNWDAKTLRYYYAMNHYRTPIDYAQENIQHAENSLQTLNNFINDLLNVKKEGRDEMISELVRQMKTEFENAMDNDFDSPAAIAAVFKFMHDVNKIDLGKEDAEDVLEALKDIDSVFGVLTFEKENVPEEVVELVRQRDEARDNKEWKKADKLRDKIKKKGYVVEDKSDGPVVKSV